MGGGEQFRFSLSAVEKGAPVSTEIFLVESGAFRFQFRRLVRGGKIAK